MRTLTRTAALSGLSAVLLTTMVSAALGGGSVWHFEGYHRPGDVVVATTAVAWSHNDDLGIPEDGPYLIYLAPSNVAMEGWPGIPEEGLLVGIVEVSLGPFIADDGESYGPHHAVARFEIPDVPVGSYQIFHCNDPCTTTLGDVIGGWDLRVLAGSGGRPAETIAAEVRASIPSAPLVVAAAVSTTTTLAGDPAASPATVNASTALEQSGPEPVDRRRRGEHSVGMQSEQMIYAPPPAAISFDSLWLSTVGFVGLILIVSMVRVGSAWRRGLRASSGMRNEPGATGVSTDE